MCYISLHNVSLIDRVSLVEFEHRSALFDAQEGRQESAGGLLSGLLKRIVHFWEATVQIEAF